MSTPASAVVTGRRACAGLALGSAALHGLTLHHAATPAATVLMLVMIATCIACAHDLWTRGTTGAWVLVATMNVAMVALHLPAGSHHHRGVATPPSVDLGGATVMDPAMTAATAIATLEVLIAVAVLYRRSRVTARRFGVVTPG